MAILYPFRENYPIAVQLWQYADSREPGEELNLEPAIDPVTLFPRELRLELVDSADVVVWDSLDYPDALAIAEPYGRGVLEFVITDWSTLIRGGSYLIRVYAYNVIYDCGQLQFTTPEPAVELLNGVEVYAGPREVLELLGQIPGANVMVSVPLDLQWLRNLQGYWMASIPATQTMFGLWIEDVHLIECEYSELATAGGDRAWCRVRSGTDIDMLYVKTDQNLNKRVNRLFVETAYDRYVLRCIEEATREFNRRTGKFFSKKRIRREVYRGLSRQRQMQLRSRPAYADAQFRLDAMNYSREVFRSYDEGDLQVSDSSFRGDGQVLHLDSETGIITLNQNLYDWWDNHYGAGFSAGYTPGNFASLPAGENNIEVSYVAGYDKPPTDVAEAIANMAAIRQAIYWDQMLAQGLQGLSIGCVNLNFGQLNSKWAPAWQASADRIIESYQSLELEEL